MLPKVERKQAVLKTKISPKPYISLTDADVIALWKFDKRIAEIIFFNQAEWFAIYKEAQAAIQAHENYEADLLGGGDKKK